MSFSDPTCTIQDTQFSSSSPTLLDDSTTTESIKAEQAQTLKKKTTSNDNNDTSSTRSKAKGQLDRTVLPNSSGSTSLPKGGSEHIGGGGDGSAASATTANKDVFGSCEQVDADKGLNQKVMDQTKTILSIGEIAFTIDLTSENHKEIHIELNEKCSNCNVAFQSQTQTQCEQPNDKECDHGAVTELENSSNDVCKFHSFDDDVTMEAKVIEIVSNVMSLFFVYLKIKYFTDNLFFATYFFIYL